MEIIYKSTQSFDGEQLKRLFLSVEWSSGQYPDKLVVAMENSSTVFSAWEGETLVGLINVLDDGIMTAYVHYLLVDPRYQGKGIGRELVRLVLEKYQSYLRIVLVAYEKEKAFYERCGLTASKDSIPMFVTSLWT